MYDRRVTTIVSANVGSYDRPATHVAQSVPVDYVTVTDNPGGGEPRRVAKGPKLRPWLWAPDGGPWIWLDAAFDVVSPAFVADMLELVGSQPVAMFEHPFRDCLYDEADAVGARHQANHYRMLGVPAGLGLWAAGVIVYTTPCEYLANVWAAELAAWCLRDQVSLPVVLERVGVRPVTIPGNIFDNDWLTWRHHLT